MRYQSLRWAAAIVVFYIVSNLFSCEKSVSQPLALPAGCDTTNLTYSNSIQTILISGCGALNYTCHGGGVSTHQGNFSTYSSLQSYAAGGKYSEMWSYVYNLKKMPLYPYQQLDACSSAKLKQWLLDGAPL